jgi:hypothetical protein
MVGMLAAGFFVSAHGGVHIFWTLAQKVSMLHHVFGLLLIVVVFWFGFVGTWVIYSVLLWVAHRYLRKRGGTNL